jgi:hypothetical protein
MADSVQPDPLVCAYCGEKNVYPCSDRVDDEWGGHSITVLRCTYCGKDA